MPLLLQGVLERDGGLPWELVIHITTYMINQITFLLSVLLKNVDYLLIAKPVLQLTTWRSAATEWPLGVLPVVGSLH